MSSSGQDQSKQQQQQQQSKREAKEIQDEKAKKEASGVLHAHIYEGVMRSLSMRALAALLLLVAQVMLVMQCCIIDNSTLCLCYSVSACDVHNQPPT
jgi:hypothetical protein